MKNNLSGQQYYAACSFSISQIPVCLCSIFQTVAVVYIDIDSSIADYTHEFSCHLAQLLWSSDKVEERRSGHVKGSFLGQQLGAERGNRA